MVSQQELKGQWNNILGAVKQKFSQVTGDDLMCFEGGVEQLVGLIQRKTGQSREQIEAFINSAASEAGNHYERLADSLSRYADGASETIHNSYDSLSASAQRGLESTVTAVRRRPVESVALAVGAGLLAGVILGLSTTRRGR